MQRFPSKRDWWLGAILWLPLLGALVLTLIQQEWVGAMWLALVNGLTAILWFGIVYEIDEGNLSIKIGPLNTSRIAIKEIESLKASKNLLSSPAASLDRLAIKDEEGKVVIVSPKDKRSFIDALHQINPEIQVHGIK